MRRALKGTRAKEWHGRRKLAMRALFATASHRTVGELACPFRRRLESLEPSVARWRRGAEALVWSFVPQELHDNDAPENSADRN